MKTNFIAISRKTIIYTFGIISDVQFVLYNRERKLKREKLKNFEKKAKVMKKNSQ